MALRLDDKWIWDFWLVEEDDRFHIFYLQAPKSLVDPDLRHWNVSIGHAVSADLTRWEVLPDALSPGPAGSWDDKSTWTGSIIEKDGLWHLFYTGTSTEEDGQIQRIGLATSSDLVTWARHGEEPLIEADPRWYETIDAGLWHDQAWRDPWVFRHEDGHYYATITARANSGPARGRGVVGHARSADLLEWEVGPPITTPDGFGQAEVSQLVAIGDAWYLLFCSDMPTQSETRRRNGAGTGTYYVRGESPLGPFDLTHAMPLLADRHSTRYAGRVHHLDDVPVLLAWEWMHPEHGFVGAISDPLPVTVATDGALSIDLRR